MFFFAKYIKKNKISIKNKYQVYLPCDTSSSHCPSLNTTSFLTSKQVLISLKYTVNHIISSDIHTMPTPIMRYYLSISIGYRKADSSYNSYQIHFGSFYP